MAKNEPKTKKQRVLHYGENEAQVYYSAAGGGPAVLRNRVESWWWGIDEHGGFVHGVQSETPRDAARKLAEKLGIDLVLSDESRAVEANEGDDESMTTKKDDGRMTYEEFAEREGITMTCRENPNPPARHKRSIKAEGGTAWLVTLRRDKERLAVPFHLGPGHRSQPSLRLVLSALADDAARVENNEHTEDTLAEVAEKLEADARRLADFLGRDAYEALLWRTGNEGENLQ